MPSPTPPPQSLIQKLGNVIEHNIERTLFGARWLLAPFYLGLALALVVLLIKFIEEFFHIARRAFTASEADVILGVLSLVDLALTGSLLVIVIFSGYENFVSKIDHSSHEDWPSWMGTIDFTALKLKLLSSIVAISAIQLLKQFMAVKELYSGGAKGAAIDPAIADRQLFWYVVIHLVFVASSVLLALSDRIAGGNHVAAEPAQPPPATSSTAASETGTPAARQAGGQHGHGGGERRKA